MGGLNFKGSKIPSETKPVPPTISTLDGSLSGEHYRAEERGRASKRL